jgi:hypothetical protein
MANADFVELGRSLSGDRVAEAEFMPFGAIITESLPKEKIRNQIRLDFDEIDELCSRLKEVV